MNPRRLIHIPTLQDCRLAASGNTLNERMAEAWQRQGFSLVSVRPGLKGLLLEIAQRRNTTGVINFLENILIDSKGRVTAVTLMRYLRSVIKYRLLCKRLIQFRHNHYPHDTAPESAALARRIIDLVERIFFDRVAVLSGHVQTNERYYVPHPVYEFQREHSNPTIQASVVFFGRIGPYKHLEDLIAYWKGDYRLVIAGRCLDSDYLKKLRACAAGKNVEFVTESLSDDDARDLVSSSVAMVLPHSGQEMIVSSSIYFALSCGVPLISAGLEHARWLQEQGIPGVVYIKRLEDLPSIDFSELARFDRKKLEATVAERFGRKAMDSSLRQLIQGFELPGG